MVISSSGSPADSACQYDSPSLVMPIFALPVLLESTDSDHSAPQTRRCAASQTSQHLYTADHPPPRPPATQATHHPGQPTTQTTPLPSQPTPQTTPPPTPAHHPRP